MPSNIEMVETGILMRTDIGMGGWRLQKDNGHFIDLYGPIPAEMSGLNVTVKGYKTPIGIGMGGKAMKVISIQRTER